MVDRSYGGRNVPPTEAGTLAAAAVRRREQQQAADRQRRLQQEQAAFRRSQQAMQESMRKKTSSGWGWGRKPPPRAKKGPCFVATAAFGDYDAPEVLILRAYRDRFLARHRMGMMFIRFYYFLSPPIAAVLEKSRFLQLLTRSIFLRPLVAVLRKAVVEESQANKQQQ